MSSFKPPSTLNLEGNVADSWRKWKQRFQLYMEASGSMKKREKQRVAIFLHLIGRSTGNLQHILVIDRGAKARRLIPEI